MRIIKWVQDSSLKSAGLFTAVEPLISLLEASGKFSVTLVCEKKADDNSHWPIESIFSIKEFLFKRTERKSTIHHCHGIWGVHSIICWTYSLLFNQPLIISPHGMLDNWAMARSARKKQLALFLYKVMYSIKKFSFHALTNAERNDIASFFGEGADIVIVPNGVFLPIARKSKNIYDQVNVIFLGRLHEKKGIYELLDAWSLFQKIASNNKLNLTVAGWGDESIEKTLESYKGNNFSFVGSVFGTQKDRVFKDSHFLILPSFSEGLPMSILESWSYGIPTIMSDNCNVPEGFENKCAIRVETNKLSILSAFSTLDKMSNNDYVSMSYKSIDLVNQSFSWDKIITVHENKYGAMLYESVSV